MMRYANGDRIGPGGEATRPQVVIVSDVRLFRESLASSLRKRSDIEIIDSVSAHDSVIELIAMTHPDAVLVDAAVADAIRFVHDIVTRVPAARVIAFGAPASGPPGQPFSEVGVAAYVDRDASTDDLVATLHSLLRGSHVCPRDVAARLARQASALSASSLLGVSATLTRREREILGFIDRGLSNKQIARDLRLSHATVKNHVHNILDKLEVHRRGEAAARLRNGGPWEPLESSSE